jgi:hypothetical protein
MRITLFVRYAESDAVGCVRSFMNIAMNSVIHQKKRLTMNHPRKLCPLFFAIVAGNSASAIHNTIPRMNIKTLTVYPRNVVANISDPPITFCAYIRRGTGIVQ